jgi:hypothetical protein
MKPETSLSATIIFGLIVGFVSWSLVNAYPL